VNAFQQPGTQATSWFWLHWCWRDPAVDDDPISIVASEVSITFWPPNFAAAMRLTRSDLNRARICHSPGWPIRIIENHPKTLPHHIFYLSVILFYPGLRPLNHYGLTEATVTCPVDQGRADTLPYSLFLWVGNFYMFNFGGYPPFTTGGLDGESSTQVGFPSGTVLFADRVPAFPTNPTGWHKPKPAGNALLVDGHAGFYTAQTVTNLTW